MLQEAANKQAATEHPQHDQDKIAFTIRLLIYNVILHHFLYSI